MDKSQRHGIEQNEPDTEGNLLYNPIFTKFMNGENISFWIQVKLIWGSVLTVSSQAGHPRWAYWDAEDIQYCVDADICRMS